MNSDRATETPSREQLDAEIEKDILAELDSLDDDNDEWDDDEGEEYERVISIRLPVSFAEETGRASIHLPVRLILTLLAEFDSDEREWILSVRDEYYSGDHEDDEGYTIEPPTWLPPSFSIFDLAKRRYERAEIRARRLERRKVQLEAQAVCDARHDAEAAKRRAPFATEYSALEAEWQDIAAQWEALHDDALVIVTASAGWESDREVRLAEAELEINARASALRLEADKWRVRKWLLEDRTYAEARLNQADS